MIDKKTFTVGVLSVTALLLLVANLMVPQRVDAQAVIKDRDYTAVTARTPKGGDALYLTDNRTGRMAAFVYDPSARGLQVRAVQPVSKAFSARAGTGAREDRNERRPGVRN